MKLTFMRHGIAEGQFSLDEEKDFQRQLSAEGRKKLQSSLKRYKKFSSTVDVIFTSPLVRAVQTAELFWSYVQTSDFEIMSELDILDDPKNLIEYISFLPSDGHYVFVGHSPHLVSVICSLLDIPSNHDFLNLKKGGICELEGGMWKGFTLELLVGPKFLRAID